MKNQDTAKKCADCPRFDNPRAWCKVFARPIVGRAVACPFGRAEIEKTKGGKK